MTTEPTDRPDSGVQQPDLGIVFSKFGSDAQKELIKQYANRFNGDE